MMSSSCPPTHEEELFEHGHVTPSIVEAPLVESEAVMRLESGGELSNFRVRKFFDNRGKDRKRRRRGPTKWAFNTGTIKVSRHP